MSRAPKYKTPEEMQEAIEEYFDQMNEGVAFCENSTADNEP